MEKKKKSEVTGTDFDWTDLVAIVVLVSFAGLIICNTVTAFKLNEKVKVINERIYPDGNDQKLVTECQMREQIGKIVGKDTEHDGYYLDSNGNWVYGDILGETEDYYCIRYWYDTPVFFCDEHIRIIKKEGFIRYLTLEERVEQLENKIK